MSARYQELSVRPEAIELPPTVSIEVWLDLSK
jgi:hypothetical protein